MYSLRFSSLAAIQRYKRSFAEKNQGNQIKDSGVANDINQFNSVWKENSATLLTLEMKNKI